MKASGPNPGILPETAFRVQIDTTLNRPLNRSSQRFQRFDTSFNRTVVMVYELPVCKCRFGQLA
jgi:hypothetical protein